MNIQDILDWQIKAVPNPTDKNRAVMLGVHFEEVAECITSLGGFNRTYIPVNELGTYLKESCSGIDMDTPDRKELLDALCDQIVTAVGVARMFNLDIVTGLDRVNQSNWSKFIDREPIFNEHGKVAKGPNYVPPDLDGLY